jgi:phospholipase C
MMMLSGAAGMAWTMPESLKRAVSIDPQAGSSYLDAEHIVILMQENRSFDHCFGTLQGVRGYNDRHTITQPNRNSVWVQSGNSGDTYSPFRFNINDTKITWMGSIPHSRPSQIDAWNYNRYDDWINAKRSGRQEYANIPLTMGHYTREDLPFNHAMADAFTICDQNFCSVIGPTRPNRLFFWSGTNRGQKSGDVKAYVRNNFHYGQPQWKLFPEWLEENGISWRFYQNEITAGSGLNGEQTRWLGNFGLNPMEWFTPYHVRFYPGYVRELKDRVKKLPEQIKELEKKLQSLSLTDKTYNKTLRAIEEKSRMLYEAKSELKKWNQGRFEKLTKAEKNLHNRAFTTNAGDRDYHDLTKLNYRHNGKDRSLLVPKGDILYQFRKDVQSGQLPTVTWLAPPEYFSDHPAAPWYGAWYTSEALDILTQNPEVWKKTIFIFTYDENDGYFDHIPPFTAPDPTDEKTGKCSPDINVSGVEYIRREDELREGVSKKSARTGPVGLGFRVPMIIASPWSRGGRVCSEVFDHTSTLQFLEHFINEKYNKQIRVGNISNWRRTICGDMTSAFREYEEGRDRQLEFLEKDPHIEKIYDAKFKKEPSDYKNLSDEEIQKINRDPASSPYMPIQEPGTRPSCGLPYQLYAEGQLTKDKKAVRLTMEARDEVFGNRTAGAPFKVYAPGKYITLESEKKNSPEFEAARAWDYAVVAGDQLADMYPLSHFKGSHYFLRMYGPNGFFRELKGDKNDPLIEVSCGYQREKQQKNKLTGNLALLITNRSQRAQTIQIADNAYNNGTAVKKIPASGRKTMVLNLKRSHSWYDITLRVNGYETFRRQYAGRVETGAESYSDPAMG